MLKETVQKRIQEDTAKRLQALQIRMDDDAQLRQWVRMDSVKDEEFVVEAAISPQRCAEAEYQKYKELFGEQPPDPSSVDEYLDAAGVEERPGDPKAPRSPEWTKREGVS